MSTHKENGARKLTRCIIWLLGFVGFGNLAAQTSIFEEVSAAAKLNISGRNRAVAFADYDGDRLPDIFVSRMREADVLYRNLGDGTFEDMAPAYGLNLSRSGGMAVWGDFDNDGRQDLYLAGLDEPNLLFMAQPDGTFLDRGAAAGVGNVGKTEALGLLDFDSDGYLDIFVFNRGGENALYRNLGDGTFENVISEAGIFGRGNAMGLAIADYDRDGDQDIYLVYDGKQANSLYQNRGDGSFVDVAETAGVALRAEGMAPAFGDFNNDGYPDLYITNMFENVLFQNQGDGAFADVTRDAGVGDAGMGWGVTWFDYDNDGWSDLYVANASSFTTPPAPNLLYKNNADGTFTVVNAQDPSSSLLSGFGAACADFDRDGYLDLFVTNEGATSQLFRNLGFGNNWLELRLSGTTSNRDALGARVAVRAGGVTQTREISGGMGWVSQNSRAVHFGLAAAKRVDWIEIRWPSGRVETYANISANQQLVIRENEGILTSVVEEEAAPPAVFSLSEAYPNPFSAAGGAFSNSVKLEFAVSGESALTTQISVFNILGQRVRTLVQGRVEPGRYPVSWDGRSASGRRLSPGIYLIRLTAGRSVETRKILLLR